MGSKVRLKPKLRSDREFMLAAAKLNYHALEYASNEFASRSPVHS